MLKQVKVFSLMLPACPLALGPWHLALGTWLRSKLGPWLRSNLVNKNNLNYVGPTPNVEYYNNNIDIVSYTASLSVIAGDNDTGSTQWSLREETLKHLI
jgi:hypothetical protein